MFQHSDQKGSIARGLLRLTADIQAGESTALPGETPLQHAQRLQRDTLPERMGNAIDAFRESLARRDAKRANGDDGQPEPFSESEGPMPFIPTSTIGEREIKVRPGKNGPIAELVFHRDMLDKTGDDETYALPLYEDELRGLMNWAKYLR